MSKELQAALQRLRKTCADSKPRQEMARSLAQLSERLKARSPLVEELRRLCQAREELGAEIEGLEAQRTALQTDAEAAPFYIRVFDTDEESGNGRGTTHPIHSNVLIGKEAIGVERAAVYSFGTLDTGSLDKYLETLHDQERYAYLFEHPHVIPAIRACGQQLELNLTTVSRIHALLELRQSRMDADLFMHTAGINSVMVNGEWVDRTSPPLINGRALHNGDLIEVREDGPKIKVYKAPVYVKGLVIACDSKDRDGHFFETEAGTLEEAISSANRYSSTERLLGKNATPEGVSKALAGLTDEHPDALLIVVINAHGHEKQISLWEGRMTKREIDKALAKIPCRKLVIVNSCHAGGVWEDSSAPNTLFLLSSKGDELTHGGRFLYDVAEFIRKNIQRGKPADFKALELGYDRAQTPTRDRGDTMFVG